MYIQGFFVEFRDLYEIYNFLTSLPPVLLCAFSEQIIVGAGLSLAWIVVTVNPDFSFSVDFKRIP